MSKLNISSLFMFVGLAILGSISCNRSILPTQPTNQSPTATVAYTPVVPSLGVSLMYYPCGGAVTSGSSLAITLCMGLCNSGAAVTVPVTVVETMPANNGGFQFLGWGFNGTFPYSTGTSPNPNASGTTMVFPSGLAAGACVTITQLLENYYYPNNDCQSSVIFNSVSWNSAGYFLTIPVTLTVPCLSTTPTYTITATSTITPTPTQPATLTSTVTPSVTQTHSVTPTATLTSSAVSFLTITSTSTPLFSATLTPTPLVTTTATLTNTTTVYMPTVVCTGGNWRGEPYYSSPISMVNGEVYFMSIGSGMSGTVPVLHYFSYNPGAGVSMALYSDNGGQPGTALAFGGNTSSIQAWNTIAINNPVVDSSSSYWLAIQPLGTGIVMGGDSLMGSYLTQNTGSIYSYAGSDTSNTGYLGMYLEFCPSGATNTTTPTPTGSPQATLANTLTPTLTNTATPTVEGTVTMTTTFTNTVTPTSTLLVNTPVSTYTLCPGSVNVGDVNPETSSNSVIGDLYLNRFQIPENMTLQTMSTYFSPLYGATYTDFNLAVYADNGSGTGPTSLLGQTGPLLFVGSGWMTAPLTQPVTVNAGAYVWLGFVTDKAGILFSSGVTGAVMTSAGVVVNYSSIPAQITVVTTPGPTGNLFSIYTSGCPLSGTPLATLTQTSSIPTLTMTITPTVTVTPVLDSTVVNTPTLPPCSGPSTTFGANPAASVNTLIGIYGTILGSNIASTKYSLPQGALVNELVAQIPFATPYPNPLGQVSMAIYSDTGSGPGTLIVQSNPVSFVYGQTWQYAPITPTFLAAGNYWLAAQGEISNIGPPSSTLDLGYVGDSNPNAGVLDNVTFGPFPSTFSVTSTYPGDFLIYANYCPAGATPTATISSTPSTTATVTDSVTPTVTSTPASSLCSPVAASICVSSDDYSVVYIGGTLIGTFPYAGAPGTSGVANPTCMSVPTALLTGSEVCLAIETQNTSPNNNYSAWDLDVTCSSGGHSEITSSGTGISVDYVATGNPAPVPASDGSGNPWYSPAYTGGSFSTSYCSSGVTISTWANTLFDPTSGADLPFISNNCSGDYSPSNSTGALFWRQCATIPQSHNLLGPPNLTLSETMASAVTNTSNNTVTINYSLALCNSGGPVTTGPTTVVDNISENFTGANSFGFGCWGYGDSIQPYTLCYFTPMNGLGNEPTASDNTLVFPSLGTGCVTMTAQLIQYYDVLGSTGITLVNQGAVSWPSGNATSNALTYIQLLSSVTITPTFTVTSTPTPGVSLTISKTTLGPTSGYMENGTPITFIMNVCNSAGSTGPAMGVTVTDNITNPLSWSYFGPYSTWTETVGSSTVTLSPISEEMPNLTFTLDNLPAGYCAPITFLLTAYYLQGSDLCQVVSDNATVNLPGGAPVTSNTVSITISCGTVTPTPTVTYYPTSTMTVTPTTTPTGAYWTYEGSPDFTSGGVTLGQLAFDSNNNPYVAFIDYNNSDKATVVEDVGGTWVTVGNPDFSPQIIYGGLALAFNNNTPYVAFSDATYKPSVMAYSGSWSYVGSLDFSSATAEEMTLVMSGGTPYVAFMDDTNPGTPTIYVMDYSGGNWVTVGGTSVGVGFYPSLAVDGSGNPYVAFESSGTSFVSKVMEYTGGTWTTVGGTVFSNAISPSLAINSGNTPYLAFEDSGNNDELTVMEYNGGSWSAVGSADFSPATYGNVALAFNPSGVPYVAFTNNSNDEATVMDYSGGSWSTVGNPSFSPNTNLFLSLAFNGVVPFVAYADGSNNSRLSVMYY